MLDALHDVVDLRPRGHHQLFRHGIGLHGQRMVAGGGHRIGDAFEDLIVDMLHQAGFAVHDGRRVAYGRAEHFGQRLHAEAHAEHGLGLLRAQANHAFAGTGIGRSARAGRNKHAVVFVDHIGFARIDRIVAHHRHRGTQRLQIADNRVNERIVVVHDQNACGIGHHAPINVGMSAFECFEYLRCANICVCIAVYVRNMS